MDLSIQSEELSSLMDGGRSGDISRTASAQKTTVSGVVTTAVPKPKVKKYKTRSDDYWDQHRYEDSQGSYFTGSSSYYYTDGEDEDDVDVKRPSLPPPKITSSPSAASAKKTATVSPQNSPAPKKPVSVPQPPPPKQESEKSLSFTKTESDMHFTESDEEESPTKHPPSAVALKSGTKVAAVESSELAFTEEGDEDDDLVFTQDATPLQKPVSPPHKMDDTSELVFTEDSVSPSQDRPKVSTSLNFTEDTTSAVSKSGMSKPSPATFNPRPSLPEDDLHFTAASTTNGDELAFSTVSDSTTPAATPKNASINPIPSSAPQTAVEKLAAMEAANRARTANLLKANNDDDDDKTLNFTADSAASASNSRRPSTSPGSALNFSVTSTYSGIATGESNEDEASQSKSKFGSASPTALKIRQMEDQESTSRESIASTETQAHEASLRTLESYKTLCVVEVTESTQRSEQGDVEKSEWNSIMCEIFPIVLESIAVSETNIRNLRIKNESSARSDFDEMCATVALMVSTISSEKTDRASLIQEEDTSRTHIQNDCTRQLELQLEEEAARAAAESWEEVLAGTASRQDEQRKLHEVDEGSEFEQIFIEAITSEEAALRLNLLHSKDLESELIQIEAEVLSRICTLEAEYLEQRKEIILKATRNLEVTKNLEVTNLEKHEEDLRSTISISCVNDINSLVDQQRIEGVQLQARLAFADTTLQHTHIIQSFEELEFTEFLGSHTCLHTEISKFTSLLREEALGKYILEHNDASTRALYGLMEREQIIRSENSQRQSNEFMFQDTIKVYLLLQSSNVCEHRIRESLAVLEATELASLLQLHQVELNHYNEVEAERQNILHIADEAYKALVEAETAGWFGTYLTYINMEESIAREAFEHDELQSSVRITALSEKQLDFHIRNLLLRQSTIKSEAERRTLKEEEEMEIRDALHKMMVDGVIDLEQDIRYAAELAIREQSSRAEMMNRAKLINEVRGIALRERLTTLEQEEVASRRRIFECEELVRSSKVFIFDQQNVFMAAVTFFYEAKERNAQLFQEWSIGWMEGYSELLLYSSMEILERASNCHRDTQHQLARLSKELSSIEFSELMGRKMIQNEINDWWLGDGDQIRSVQEIAMFERQLISEVLEDEQVSRWKIIASERREWWGQQAPIPDTQNDTAFTHIPTASSNRHPMAAHSVNHNKPSRPLSSSASLNISRSNLSLRRYYTKLNQWAHEEVSARENFYSALSKSQSTAFVPASILPHRPHSARTLPTTAAGGLNHEDSLATSLPVIQSGWTGHIPKKPTSLQPRLRAAAVQNDEAATRENLLTSQQDAIYSMAYRLAAAKENDSKNRPLTWGDIDQLCKR